MDRNDRFLAAEKAHTIQGQVNPHPDIGLGVAVDSGRSHTTVWDSQSLFVNNLKHGGVDYERN